MTGIVSEFKRSGLKGAEFARAAGMNYQTFADWLQQRCHGRGDCGWWRGPAAAASFPWPRQSLDDLGPPVICFLGEAMLYEIVEFRILVVMSTISAILKPSPDGTLHLPVPTAWRQHSIRVTAELEPVDRLQAASGSVLVTPQPGSLKGFRMAADFGEPLEDFKEYME